MWLLQFSACFLCNRLPGIGHHLNKTEKRKAPMRIKNLKPIGSIIVFEILCKRKGVNIVEAEMCRDHVHMLVEIPPSMNPYRT